jgi:hypothetical protein
MLGAAPADVCQAAGVVRCSRFPLTRTFMMVVPRC